MSPFAASLVGLLTPVRPVEHGTQPPRSLAAVAEHEYIAVSEKDEWALELKNASQMNSHRGESMKKR
jgi:hypothetical protein